MAVAAINRLSKVFVRLAEDRAIVTIQNPLGLNEHSEPKPE
jgi:hypothetical protein